MPLDGRQGKLAGGGGCCEHVVVVWWLCGDCVVGVWQLCWTTVCSCWSGAGDVRGEGEEGGCCAVVVWRHSNCAATVRTFCGQKTLSPPHYGDGVPRHSEHIGAIRRVRNGWRVHRCE